MIDKLIFSRNSFETEQASVTSQMSPHPRFPKLPSAHCRFQMSEEKRQPQSITVPPLCLTVGKAGFFSGFFFSISFVGPHPDIPLTQRHIVVSKCESDFIAIWISSQSWRFRHVTTWP